MELRHLRYFIAVAEELNVTRAARRLGIAQPPLSQQIQQLERDIGTSLLLRGGRTIRLTEAGEAFLQDARAICAAADQARRRALRISSGEEGHLRVGFTGSASFSPLIPQSFHLFRTTYPRIRLDLSERATSVLLQDLADERIDIAFIRPAPAEEIGLRVRRLPAEEMLVAVPVRHRLASRGAIELHEVREDTFILYPRVNGQALYDAIIASCHKSGFSPVIGQEAPQLVSTLNLVAVGIGIALVPASMAQSRTVGVTYLRIVTDPPTAGMSLACRDNSVLAAVTSFWAILDDILATG